MTAAIPPSIVVLGSLNLDNVWTVERLPTSGDTILATSTAQAFGGKGGNQAVAAARQGGAIALLGAVGSDEEGRKYRAHLEAEGVDPRSLAISTQASTGAAHVYVDSCGENQIVVNPGANSILDAAFVRETFASRLGRASLLLTQLECPTEGICEAMRIAHAGGAGIVLNASPYRPEFRWDVPIFAVIVNERECSLYFGGAPQAIASSSLQARRELLTQHRLTHLIITRGADSTLLINSDSCCQIQTHRVRPIDTVGAGDTFAGVFAQRIADGLDVMPAIRDANTAAALSTLRCGAQDAMPTREQVDRIAFLAHQGQSYSAYSH